MSDLGMNKIIGAGLATALGLMGLNMVSGIVFGGGGHGTHHEDGKSYDEIAAERYAYYVSTGSGGSSEVEETVFDLGLLLAGADIVRGERSLKGKCATCHTWNDGGADGTGPNLYGIMGKDIAATPGFNYSSGMAELEGNWTWEEMNAWLENPGKHVPGTKMAFAGLRKEPERMNALAFLASVSPDGPAFPEPLPAIVEEASVEGEEGAIVEAGGEIPFPVDEESEDAGEAIEAVIETAEDAAELATDAASDAAGDLVGAITDTAEDATDDIAGTVTDAVEEVVEDASSDED